MPAHGDVTPADVISPGLPSRESYAQAPAHTREADPAEARRAPSPVWVQGLMNGASVWHSQPPSLSMIWERHLASARHYNAALIRQPRYLWGALHLALAASIYLVAWVCHSFPLFVCAAAIVVAAHWLL